MTNNDLLLTPPKNLGPAGRRRQFELRVEMLRVPCAACRVPVSALEASGTDIDDFRPGPGTTICRCPHCRAELERVAPPLACRPGWHWRVSDPWLLRLLAGAQAFDRMTRTRAADGV
jgi:hypothetical protein